MPTKILMPALSPTMKEGNLVRWLKKEGDMIRAGDVMAEIETDKATMEVEAVDEGLLAKIYVPEGTENVAVNTLIAVLLEEGEDAASLDVLSTDPVAAPSAEPIIEKKAPEKEVLSHPQGNRVLATPLARRIASDRQIDLSRIAGTGPRGRIIKADLEAIEPLPTMEGDAPYREEKLSTMRKVIAKRLTEAKQTVPHFYLTVECEIDRLLEVRHEVNATLSESERLSVNDFIMRAAGLALRDVPEANASYAETHVRLYERVDISLAVAIEGGLVTPVLRGVEHKSVKEIAKESKTLIAKARAGKLMPEDYQGGTFSLSNLGMFGIKEFSAVINPPQGCILAVGAGEKRAVVRGDALAIATVMSCTLSVDHRVVDGAVGARLLKAFKNYITHPLSMVL